MTVETFRTAVLEISKPDTMKLFHQMCDRELLCPRCGEYHGTVENYRRNFRRILKATTDHLDHQRLREAMERERAHNP
jgi:hypothetical protein